MSAAIPLLILAEELDLVGVLGASSDKVLPLLAKGIELSPALLPVAGQVLKLPSPALFGGAAASLLAAFATITLIPDDSILNVALQTVLVVPLGALIPGALGVGGFILSKLE